MALMSFHSLAIADESTSVTNALYVVCPGIRDYQQYGGSGIHVFDNTTTPPQQRESIQVREQPGWITFSLDGLYAYPSTGEVIDTKTKKILTTLADEQGREVHSEKMVQIQFQNGKPVRVGDQFGVGRIR